MLMLQLAEKLERTGGRMHMELTAGALYVPYTLLKFARAQTLLLYLYCIRASYGL